MGILQKRVTAVRCVDVINDVCACVCQRSVLQVLCGVGVTEIQDARLPAIIILIHHYYVLSCAYRDVSVQGNLYNTRTNASFHLSAKMVTFVICVCNNCEIVRFEVTFF